MIKYADIIVDLQAGDTGKGKVAHALASKPNEYTHIIRYNGGGNAGHTFYHNGEKFVTHYIPVGVMYRIKSIISPGCVVNVQDLLKEIEELEAKGIEVAGKLFIDKRTHLITNAHKQEDATDSTIGTTKTGNGPAYRDKYQRTGNRIEDIPNLNKHMIDIYTELFETKEECKILFEGAQGFELDIDWGDYPYVTSSHCTTAGALLNGVPPQKVRKVIGTAKVYNTYVGLKSFEGEDTIFSKIRLVGNEYGATTGRPRQVNWMDLNKLIQAANINGCTEIIFNKMDVLCDVGVFKAYYDGKLHSFESEGHFEEYVFNALRNGVSNTIRLRSSKSADKI